MNLLTPSKNRDCLSFKGLKGNPLKIILFLYFCVISEKEMKTRGIQLSEIEQHIKISKNSIRTGLRFLSKNYFIQKIEYKSGIDGWTRYELSNVIYKEIKEALEAQYKRLNQENNRKKLRNILSFLKAGFIWLLEVVKDIIVKIAAESINKKW